MPGSHYIDMVADVRAGPRTTRRGIIIDWNVVDRMYTVALDSGGTVRAMERDLRVTNIQEIDAPRLIPTHRDRTAFLRGLARVYAEEAVEDEHDEEIPVGVPVVYGVAV